MQNQTSVEETLVKNTSLSSQQLVQSPVKKKSKRIVVFFLFLIVIIGIVLIGLLIYLLDKDKGDKEDTGVTTVPEEITTITTTTIIATTTTTTGSAQPNYNYEGWEKYTYSNLDYIGNGLFPVHEYEGSFSFLYPSNYVLAYVTCRWSYSEEEGEKCMNIGRINFHEIAPRYDIDDLEIFDLSDERHIREFASILSYSEILEEKYIENHRYQVRRIEYDPVESYEAPESSETVIVYQVDAGLVGFWFSILPSKYSSPELEMVEKEILQIIYSIEVS